MKIISKKLFFSFLFLFSLFSFLFSAQITLAQPAMDQGLNEFLQETQLPATPLPIVIGRIVRIVLSFLGLIAVIIIIIGGFTWMTSGGNPEKIDKAKKIMIAGLIGLAIIIFAYAIVSFILKILGEGIGGGGGGGQVCTPGQCLGCHWICKSDGSGGEPTSGCENLCGGLPQCPCPSGTLPYITGSLPACQLSPSSGPIGTAVTIRGCRFGQYASSTSKVYFGDKEAEIVLCQGNPSWSETKIVAKVPELKEGSYQVKVVNSIGESNSKSFNVTSTPGPSIACVVPDYGKEGQEVQVFGERFGQSGVLTFNNVTSSPTFWSDNLIKVPVPPNAFSGDVVVTTNQPSNGYPFYVICESGIDCASLCCLQYECQSSEHCHCAQAEESCGNAPCCPGLSCCPDKKCRADCNVDGSCGPNGQCPSGYTCCPDNLCKINCGGNNPGQSCKMPDGTCGPDSRCTPYQCVSSVTSTSPITECRCCCRNNSGCPSGLKCETNEICYQSSTSTPAVYGLCCGCTQNNQCGIDNLCRTTEPRCCVGCQNQTNGTKCYVPGLPNNEGECCNGVCCHGYCLNGQCLTSCGNHQLEDNEQCDPTARPMFRPSQDTCQEVDPKYVGGTLGCNYNCTFDVSGCLESGQAGGIGELCIRQGVCSTGASSCQNPETYSCLVEGSDCRCCCDPKENKCPNNLTCTANKTPCTGSSRGLCCGCKDDSQCGEHSVCDSDDLCCHNLPSPTNLSFESNPNQIKISWIYPKDSFKYVTTFEIERAEKTDSACGTYLKIAEDKNCQPNTNIVNCSYIDRGNFGGKKFCYRIRARHGSQTAYSEWESGEIEVQAGQVGCQANYPYPDGCSAKFPCCRKDTKQCVTWEFCEGHCDINGDCKPPSVRYAEADFQVTTGPIGACLISVVNNKSGSPNFGQSRGYWLDEIKATGKRFGDSQGQGDNLVFEENKNAPVNDWRDETIWAQVPTGAKFDDNLVVVKKSGLPNSNAVSFKVLKQEVGPGQKCYDDNSCPLNIGVCSNPPNQNIFTCKASASNDCYCCCTPGTPDLCKNINQRLECKANQSPCTGSNRGLCCGCQNDDDCGEMGCGMIEPSPKCCYQRPSWLGLSFCENQGSPNVRLNTDITLKFDSLMDFGSLNSDQIKVSRVGACELNEGETEENGRCYLFGTISSYNSLEGNTTTTKAVFSPRNCRLKPDTEYKVEIVVGKNGQGVRSEKGVSIGDSDISCTWDSGKKCRSLSFTTVNSETLCTISWIDVQPRFQLVRELNKGVSYYGFARDESNQSVCVIGFDWSSSNSEVATVEPNSQNPRIGNATSTGAGEAIIIASASEKVCVQSPEKDRTCGKIRVDLGGPKVIEQQGCQVCADGGQSPSPWKNSTNACLNAQIVAEFDREMNQGTLNTENIKVRQCLGDNLNNPNCDNGSDIEGTITTYENRFYFQPSTPLIANKIYRVTLKSGKRGIKDINGFQLDGNRNNLEDGSPKDDYVWYFKTGNTTCVLDKVCVNPNLAKIIHPNSQTFAGEVYASNCNYLSASQFTWTWQKVKIDPWNPDQVASLTSNNRQATATSIGLGEMYVKATTEDKSDQARLIVATYPLVENKQPTGDNVCRNALIFAKFNQEMNRATLNQATVLLYKERAPIGPGQPITQFLRRIKNWVVRLIRIVKAAEFQRGEIIPEGIIISPPGQWQLVPGSVLSHNIGSGAEIKTIVSFIPNTLLEANKNYRVVIKGGQTGVKSKYDIEMESNYIWTFTTGQEICKIERVEIEPKNYTFIKNGEQKDFTATAYTRNNQPIYPVPGSYTWNWSWESSNNEIVTVTGNNSNPSTGVVTADNKNGFATITAKAIDSEGKEFKDQASVRVFLCENPWTYENSVYNFELSYCRDFGQSGTGDDLPQLTGPSFGPTSGDLKLNLLFNVFGKPDVVGLQVYNNFDHLTPLKWYYKNVPNPGSPGSVVVDGYSAIREGRTVYVGAANLASDKLYSNIYLISYNDGASTETINIVNQLIKNWQFNTNKDNSGKYIISSEDKAKIQRDLTRIYHFNEMAPVFENYKKQKGYYPKLEAGTYIIGLTTSRWPSWQQTLGQELGQPLPIDPINKFATQAGCHSEGVPPNGGYWCCADCPENNPQCDGTCYNPAPNKKKYECLAGSNVYQYNVNSDYASYSLYSKFEYSQPNLWQHNCSAYNDQSSCGLHHWCVWNNACQAKNLNYSDNPCQGMPNGTICQCFNMRYQPIK